MKTRNVAISLLCLSLWCFVPLNAHAEGAAPELFNVKDIIIQYPRFSDPKASDVCGVARDQVMATIVKTLGDANVPAENIDNAKPLTAGLARIDLIPEIDTHADDSLDCVSAVSLSAESRANVVVPPIATLRSVTIRYWHQHTLITSSQSLHTQTLTGVMQKMAQAFAQQYRLDQPPELPK